MTWKTINHQWTIYAKRLLVFHSLCPIWWKLCLCRVSKHFPGDKNCHQILDNFNQNIITFVAAEIICPNFLCKGLASSNNCWNLCYFSNAHMHSTDCFWLDPFFKGSRNICRNHMSQIFMQGLGIKQQLLNICVISQMHTHTALIFCWLDPFFKGSHNITISEKSTPYKHASNIGISSTLTLFQGHRHSQPLFFSKEMLWGWPRPLTTQKHKAKQNIKPKPKPIITNIISKT